MYNFIGFFHLIFSSRGVGPNYFVLGVRIGQFRKRDAKDMLRVALISCCQTTLCRNPILLWQNLNFRYIL